MKLLTFLFILGSLSLGFAGGVAFMTIYAKETIRDLRSQNRQLRQNVLLLKRMKKDTIEIIYPKQEDEIDFSQRW